MRFIFLLVAAVIALFWLDMMNAVIHSNIVFAGIEESNPLYMILGLILPLVGFMAYGIMHDKGYERIGFICGMGLCISGTVIALAFGGASSDTVLFLLALTGGLGGTYTEFFILTVPVFFAMNAKRPVFIASLGIILNLLVSALGWASDVWTPEYLRGISVFVLVSAAISSVVFIVLAYIIFEQYREKTLAAALHSMFYDRDGEPPASPAKTPDGILKISLTEQEAKIALLLAEGYTRSEILRKLQYMNAAEIGRSEKIIRKKLDVFGDTDPLIVVVVKQYKLTRRETDMLRYLCKDSSNEEIAAELFLSEEGVRSSIHRLVKKLPVSNRSDVKTWVKTLG
jgi:DNA-binding CsgD family transcriptional regulator